MSSTNRNSEERVEYDFYPTPKWCVARLMEKMSFFPSDQIWLEPCAGNGAIIKAIKELYPSDSDTWKAIELQSRFEPELRALTENVIIGDYLASEPGKVDVIITNPPFSLAFEIIKKALESKPRVVCMLLRLNFLGSKERSSFMREHTPDVYVLPNRPSFTGKGTDSIEYAWFVWSEDNGYGSQLVRRHAKLVMLDDTPKEQRQRTA
jgi:hypothetical protein